jgi:hypothetical protein
MSKRPRKTAKLPPPPVPAHVDLRDVPVPASMLVRLYLETFGGTYAEAKRFVLDHLHARGVAYQPLPEDAQ